MSKAPPITNRVRDLREARAMTQAELGDAIGHATGRLAQVRELLSRYTFVQG